MALIADILMVAGTLGAAAYCLVLSRRLQRFTRLDDGVGGAIAVLSAQVDDMTRALREARTAADRSEAALAAQTARAERATERLSLMMASLHDLPEPGASRRTEEAVCPAPAAPPTGPGAAVAQPRDQVPGSESASLADSPTAADRLAATDHAPSAGDPADDPVNAPAAPVAQAAPVLPGAASEDEEARRPRFLRRRPANSAGGVQPLSAEGVR